MTVLGHYQAFSLEILSEIPLQLPPFPTSSINDADHERVWITRGQVYRSFKPRHSADLVEYGISDDHSEILLHIPRVADISIDRNNRVVVESASGPEDTIVAQVIIGLVLILILKRKKLVTVHGSAVSTGEKAIVLIGERGSGKSTTAAALARCGHHMMCDDIVPIGSGQTENPGAIVLPGIPRPRLLEGAYRELFGNSRKMHSLFDGLEKYQVPIETSIGSYPLQLVCILHADPHCEELAHRQLQGSAKIVGIMEHVSVLNGIESKQEVFMHALRVFQKTPVYEIRRPKGISTLNRVVRLIETFSQNA